MTKKNKKQTTTVSQYQEAKYSGPLPLPDHFRQYEEILPGAAERILCLAERQSTHRRSLEQHVTKGDGRRAWGGLFVGAILASGCVGGGIWLVSIGQVWGGVTIATSSVATIAGVFVYGTRSRRGERSQRAGTKANRR